LIEEVCKGITTFFNASAAMITVVNGRLYFQECPQDTPFPRAIFYIAGVTHDEIMGGATDNITTVEVQFNLFSDKTDGGQEIAAMADTFITGWDWQTITVTDYNCIKMQRVSMPIIAHVDDIWQVTLNYELGIQYS